MVIVWFSFWVRCKPVSWTNEEKRAWADPYRLSHVRLVQGTQQMARFLKKPARILYMAKQQWVENTMRDKKRQKQKPNQKRKADDFQRAYYIILTKDISRQRQKYVSVPQEENQPHRPRSSWCSLCMGDTLQVSELIWAIPPVMGQQQSEVMGKKSYLRFLLSGFPSGIIFHSILHCSELDIMRMDIREASMNFVQNGFFFSKQNYEIN